MHNMSPSPQDYHFRSNEQVTKGDIPGSHLESGKLKRKKINKWLKS